MQDHQRQGDKENGSKRKHVPARKRALSNQGAFRVW